MEQNEKPNTFAQMEQNNKIPETEVNPHQSLSGEVNLDSLSNVAVKDQVKYVRPDLNGKEDFIEMVQIFMPSENEEPQISQNGKTEYWKVQILMTYGSKNVDGVTNKEYISGAKVFKNKNGGFSDISFYYTGSETQCAYLWEMVSKKLGLNEPSELSPRQFVAFLNSKPKIKIVGKQYKNYGAGPNDPKYILKNMPGEFI
jgi:hypothetical protein